MGRFVPQIGGGVRSGDVGPKGQADVERDRPPSVSRGVNRGFRQKVGEVDVGHVCGASRYAKSVVAETRPVAIPISAATDRECLCAERDITGWMSG